MTQPDTLQMRLEFAGAQSPVTAYLHLTGLMVDLDVPESHRHEVTESLTGGGATVLATEDGLRIPASAFSSLLHAPAHVHLLGDRDTRPLLLLLENPCHDGTAAAVDADAAGIEVTWFDGVTHWQEPVTRAAATALLHTGFPVVASPAAWAIISAGPDVPVVAGWAREHVDGYIEISGNVPQLVAASDLPGLWRIDETRFGMPTALAHAIEHDSGIRWATPPPRPTANVTLLPSPVPLSEHVAAELEVLASSIAADGSRVLAWDSGLGRRVVALAALTTLDDFPLLVVCQPSAVFAWRRHADLMGKTVSLQLARGSEITIVTYADLAAHRVLPGFSAVVFDDLVHALGTGGTKTATAVRRFDALSGIHRIATTGSWPSDAQHAALVLSAIRPAEFDPSMPMHLRYPASTSLTSEQRAAQHAQAYVSRRKLTDITAHTFRRSSSVTVEATEDQLRRLATLRDQAVLADPQEVLEEMLEIISSGTADEVSPKVVAAALRAQQASHEGRSVAVVTRYAGTATLLRAALGLTQTSVVDATASAAAVQAALLAARSSARVSIVLHQGVLPDLRSVDEVIIVDLPYTWEEIDRACGPAGDVHGSARVTVVHLTGSVDDRLAILAALRAHRSLPQDMRGTLTREDLRYLMATRGIQ